MCLATQKVSLNRAHYSEQSCKNGKPTGIFGQLSISIIFLFCLSCVGLLSTYLYDHGWCLLAVLIVVASGLWINFVLGSSPGRQSGHTARQDYSDCENRETLQHDSNRIADSPEDNSKRAHLLCFVELPQDKQVFCTP
jgi:hypothetical protein